MKTIYRGYDIETDAEGKVVSVDKDGKLVEATFDNLLTSEAVMAKIDQLTAVDSATAKPKPKADKKPSPPKKLSEAEGIADRKKQSDVVQGKTEKKPKADKAPAPYDKSADYDWQALDEKTLKLLYKQMQATGGTKLADLDDGIKLDELRTTCMNVHNYFRVRATEAKATNQQTKAKKAATQQETDTMATKKASKKASKKSAAKKPAAKKAAAAPKVEKFAGYPLDAKWTVLNTKNPAREGGAKFKRWELVLDKKHKTMGDLKKAKANPGTVRNAIKAKSGKVG